MKRRRGSSAPSRKRAAPESRALAGWYNAHPEVRRMWAMKEAEGLRVVVILEPTLDGDDTQPAWVANSRAWAHELEACANSFVRLEQLSETLFDAAQLDTEKALVAALGWRDPWQYD